MSSKPSRSEIEIALSGRTRKKAAKVQNPVDPHIDLSVPPRRQQVIGGDLTGVSSRPKRGLFSRYGNVNISYWIATGLVILILIAFFWPQSQDNTREISATDSNATNTPLNSAIEPVEEIEEGDSIQTFTRESDLDRAGTYREEERRESEITTLLRKAEAHIAKGEYTQPKGNNAVATYKQILQVDSKNVAAKQGLEYVNGRFLKAGFNALQKSNEAVALNALQRLGSIDKESADYQELASAIESWKISKRVNDILAKARDAFANDRLILPADDNALFYYRQALNMDRENEAAENGVQKVADTFIERASEAVLQGQFDAASAHLATVIVINPSHASIPLVEAMMEQARSDGDSQTVASDKTPESVSRDETVPSEDSVADVAPATQPDALATTPNRASDERTPQRQANEQADFDRQYLKQGLDAYYQAEYDKAAALLQPLADKGIARAQFRLAYMHYLGRGFERNRQEADRMIRAALPAIRKFAEEGRAWAQSDLGSLYEDGLVLPRDFGEAVYWYRSAAEQGYPGAQTNLGIMYARGRGVTSSRKTAIEWFQRAAKQGDSVAQRNLETLGVND